MKKINIDNLKDFDKKSFIEANSTPDKLEIEFAYKANFKNTKILRDFVDVICTKYSFSQKFISRSILISDEMNNNAIEYGSEKGGINYFRVKINKIDNNEYIFNLEVEDTGKGPNAKSALEMETLRAHKLKLGYINHSSIRGRGLFLIIVKLVDRLYFKDTKSGGLIVGIKKKVKKEI